MSRIVSRAFALLLVACPIYACTANVENPEVDQTGREGDTTCVTNCDNAQTTCVAKCTDDACKASCKTTHDDCTAKCTVTTSTGGSGGKSS
ncbi:MAG: hypothetical protein ACOY0T_40735 [Myxococcota bacterium]